MRVWTCRSLNRGVCSSLIRIIAPSYACLVAQRRLSSQPGAGVQRPAFGLPCGVNSPAPKSRCRSMFQPDRQTVERLAPVRLIPAGSIDTAARSVPGGPDSDLRNRLITVEMPVMRTVVVWCQHDFARSVRGRSGAPAEPAGLR